ncbi:MAG: DNA-directed RNA polymerase subunit omega [Bacteroidia bacterium]
MINKEIPSEIIARDLKILQEPTGNIYETLVIISKRANQLSLQQKDELQSKLEEFAPSTDSLEEVFENREQIEISTHYERLPKTTVVATEEFLAGEIYYRNPNREQKPPEEIELT